MAIEESLSTILIAAAIAIPVLAALMIAALMIALPWLADRRSDAILRKLDDN